MALAESMKNFVNDLKASRRSRHEFVKGNRETAKNIMADNRKFLQSIRGQNKINAEQTHALLESAKKARLEDSQKLKESIKASIERAHQSVLAIRQGAQGMMKEVREDTQKAHEYWASLSNDDPIGAPKESAATKTAKKEDASSVNMVDNKEDVGVNKVDKVDKKEDNKSA
jgi:hypothetical protein